MDRQRSNHRAAAADGPGRRAADRRDSPAPEARRTGRAKAAGILNLGGKRQSDRLYNIYVIYRTLLALVLVLLLVLPATRQLVSEHGPYLYTTLSLLFLVSNALLVLSMLVRWRPSNARLVALFCADVGCITLLGHASGGMDSGLVVLNTVTVAAAAVLISNRTLATLIAALAALALLFDTLWLVSGGTTTFRALFPAGLLGSLFFLVSAIVQVFALRLGRAEAIAMQRATDIHRLQRLNEETVRQLQSGVLLVDSSNRVQLLNESARRLLDPGTEGNAPTRVIGDCGPELTERLADFREGGESQGATISTLPNGTQVLDRIVSINGDVRGQLLLFLDDYAPVAAHAQALKLRSLGRLAGSIAHEIRNPLGAISHAAQLLQESPTVSEEDQHILGMVLSNSTRVNEIVESVMQVSRRKPPRPALISLADWLDQYCLERRQSPGSKALSFTGADPDARIRFDPEHLQRIVDNLVDNALRHSEEATGTPGAELEASVDTERGECTLEVIDDGAGVAEADLPRLFEPFFTRSQGGSGLGLYLCRELCELNQARIAYAPRDDGRSRFRISAAQQE